MKQPWLDFIECTYIVCVKPVKVAPRNALIKAPRSEILTMAEPTKFHHVIEEPHNMKHKGIIVEFY